MLTDVDTMSDVEKVAGLADGGLFAGEVKAMEVTR